jgi:hypothetical protein
MVLLRTLGSHSSPSRLSAAAIAGIALGALALAVFIIVLVLLLVDRGRRRRRVKKQEIDLCQCSTENPPVETYYLTQSAKGSQCSLSAQSLETSHSNSSLTRLEWRRTGPGRPSGQEVSVFNILALFVKPCAYCVIISS